MSTSISITGFTYYRNAYIIILLGEIGGKKKNCPFFFLSLSLSHCRFPFFSGHSKKLWGILQIGITLFMTVVIQSRCERKSKGMWWNQSLTAGAFQPYPHSGWMCRGMCSIPHWHWGYCTRSDVVYVLYTHSLCVCWLLLSFRAKVRIGDTYTKEEERRRCATFQNPNSSSHF